MQIGERTIQTLLGLPVLSSKMSDQKLNKTLETIITLTWQKRETRTQVRILVQVVARTRLGQELEVHGR